MQQEKTGLCPKEEKQQAQKSFARILSRAASQRQDVRSFLKTQALEQFDNDYDVFYPFVKEKEVTPGESFREVLLSYSENEEQLCRIEETLPLLNILIPDFSLFWEFSAETWDTWDDEIAVICRDDESNTLYEDGEDIGMMDSGEIPGFPCLIVKNNERLKVCNTQTRSGEKNYSYEFLHEEFDGSLTPATRDSYFEQDLEKEEPPLNFQWVATKEISPCVVKAYEEFKDFPQACQRDHIYYGLTKDKNTGVLNRNIREQIYKFRIDANAFKKMADQEGKDAFLQSTSEKKRYLTDEEILKRIWTDGKFEVVFKSYVAVENSPTPMEHRIAFSLDPRELFSISKVQVHHRNSTALRHSKNTYWVNLADLRSRTVVPSQRRLPNNVLTVPWDAYSHSLMFICL